MKLNFFVKIFSLLMVGVLLVFGLQYFIRGYYFQTAYVDTVVERNLKIIYEVREDLYLGEDLFELMEAYEITELNYYIAHESEFLFDEFSFEDLDFDEYTDGIYYSIVEDEFGYENSTYHLYAAELEEGYYLVFEQYLTGLVDANAALTRIDIYVLVIVLAIFVPISAWFSTRVSKPLKMMKTQARELGNLEFNEPLDIRTNDEIEDLSKSINLVSLKLKTAINELKDDIEKERIKDQKRRELIASLSHELKTPLTTMRAVVEGMIDNIGVYQDKEKYLNETLKYLAFMEDLSKDLIDVVGYETKRVVHSKVSIKELLTESLLYFDEVTPSYDDGYVSCNQDMIRRVLINLLSNGKKYSVDEAVTLDVSISDRAVFTIKNKGEISDEEIEKVFEPFYRVEKSRNKQTGGSGLGLFIVKTILEAHHSDYSIKNKNGYVEFRFSLELDT